ncbi:unnamed protein product [Cochlearia groenlandica]
MEPKEKTQKLNILEVATPSVSKKKQKVRKSLVVTSPSSSLVSSETNNVGEAMKKQNDVAMFLMGKVISAVARNSNFVFSPATINSSLTMVASTSQVEALRSFILSTLKSSSIDELNSVFHEVATTVLADGIDKGGPKITAANGVWIYQSIHVNPSLKDLFENFFNATFSQVDFRSKSGEVAMEVNKWVSKNTNDRMKDLIPPRAITSNTDFIYGNALYFKGTWRHKFSKSMTREGDFHLVDGNSVSRVPFLTHSRKQYINAYKGFKVLRLPFRQNNDINRNFSMYFYLPDERDGLNNLVKEMASTNGFLDSHIPSHEVEVGAFKIPKFKIAFGFQASSVFDELVDHFSEVLLYQKAFVEIDEEGAEASAIKFLNTAVAYGCCRKINFVADHPFVFLIREDKTGTVLFLGQIFDPSKSV